MLPEKKTNSNLCYGTVGTSGADNLGDGWFHTVLFCSWYVCVDRHFMGDCFQLSESVFNELYSS